MSTPAACWRYSSRIRTITKFARFTPAVQRRSLSQQIVPQDSPAESPPSDRHVTEQPILEQSNVPYKRYQRLDGYLQIQRLTDDHDEQLCANGIEGLYSPTGFQYAYTDWQTYLLKELNSRTNDFMTSTGRRDEYLINIIRACAKKSGEEASIFNFASTAYNNMFYFQGLRYGIPEIDQGNNMSTALKSIIERDFFSVASLKAEFLNRARSMFAPGFVWLVLENNKALKYSKDKENHLALLSTYGAGSPLSAAHYRQQLQHRLISFDPAGKAAHTAERAAAATLEVRPLLCVSTWQQSYIPDWEVSGRDRFLEAWWDRINWSVVESYTNITDNSVRRRVALRDQAQQELLQRQQSNHAL